MSETFSLGNAVWNSVTAPRAAARAILGAGFGLGTIALIIATSIVIDVLVYQVVTLITPPPPGDTDPALLELMQVPGISVLGIALRLVSIFILAGAVALGGKFSRHPAPFPRILTAVAWFGLVMSLLGIVQSILLFAVPGLMVVVSLGFIALQLWLFSSFIAEALRVERVGRVAMVTVIVSLVLSALVFMGAVATAPSGGI
ncbi:hypothetical protein FDP22_14840 [Paroceanicella profunda]|uniref:Yip1 domain-containing protein n=1 Tax=Paroceanicella profunda TaxID=2579971 RepID=A0A5B8FVU4_9RHOB|nr:Yip1 family protein [Paroceanicella profunda]QDL92946.1 hypothetical protein FDP22_14840 [Paroceanicella profunda]